MNLFTNIPDNLSPFLNERIPTLAQIKPLKRTPFISLLWLMYKHPNRYLHNKYDGHFHHWKHLRKILGSDYLKVLEQSCCIVITGEADNYKQITRGYKLSEYALSALHEFVAYNLAFEFIGIRPRRSKRTNMYNAIKAKNSEGTKTTNPHQINGLVKIDSSSLTKLLMNFHRVKSKHIDNDFTENFDGEVVEVERLLLEQPVKARKNWIETRIRTIATLNYLATGNVNTPHNHILQQYEESRSGRLYGTDLHLQTVPKIIRKAALKGQFDYDFENCHYAIFYQLASKCGHDLPGIEFYLNNKNVVRDELSLSVNTSNDNIKQCLIGLIYGATVNPGYKHGKIIELLGLNKAKRLFKHELFINLSNDIKAAKKDIIDSHRERTGLINAVGKRLSKKDKQDHLSHILQGYEVAMLNIILRHYPDDITLLQHDGFTTPRSDIDIVFLRQQIDFELGFSVGISKEVL